MHWFAIDKDDCGFRKCDVYNVDGIAYESIILHGLAILFGPNHGGELKNNSVHLAFSRDGFHMTRPPPPRRPFIRLPPTTNALGGRSMGLSNVQMASGSPIIQGDELLFYFGYGAAEGYVPGKYGASVYSQYVEGTGVATLRRDGFVGVAPPFGGRAAVLTTRPLVYNGDRLFVNVVLRDGGSLRVAVLPAETSNTTHALCGMELKDAMPLVGPLDATRVEMPRHWQARVAPSEAAELGALSGRRVRLQFVLEAGELFAFWLTHDPQGRSGGYLGGGAFGAASIVDR